MKYFILILMSILIVSCGKDSGSSGSNNPQNSIEEEQQPPNQPADEYLDISALGLVELLNVTISEKVDLTDNSITFKRPLKVEVSGEKISCTIDIASEAIWYFYQAGNKLQLTFPDGKKIELHKTGNSRNNLTGSWVWIGTQNGTKITKRFTFLPGQIVLNQDCEG